MSMDPSSRAYVWIAIATILGAGYGLWGPEAASPLAIPLVLWAVLILLLAWRMPTKVTLFIECVIAFVAGFGVVWTVVLGRLLATCKPPSCRTADPTTDLLYALALIAPIIALAGVEIAVRKWLVAHRMRPRR